MRYNGGTYRDDFNDNNSYGGSTGTPSWDPDWVETNDTGGATTGQIQVGNGVLRFDDGDGATVTRSVNLAGATSARLVYQVQEIDLDDDTILVQCSSDGTTWTTVDTIGWRLAQTTTLNGNFSKQP